MSTSLRSLAALLGPLTALHVGLVGLGPRRCERNCGAGLGTLPSERVSLRAECSSECPRLAWSVSKSLEDRNLTRDEDALAIGSVGKRFIIPPPTLSQELAYVVSLSGTAVLARLQRP